MELVRTTVKVGNSAGVLLPKKYLNSQVKITLEPLNIEKDVFEILSSEGLLPEVKGIYLTGSYARGEQTIESDVDVLIISNIEKRLREDKYDLLLVSEKTLEAQLEKNILPLLPMIIESKPIVNAELIERYKKIRLNEKNLKGYLEIIKSGLKLNRAALDLEGELGSKYVPDAVSYSLILNLRSMYLVDKLIKKKKWSNKEFVALIKKVTGSTLIYEIYIGVKSDKREINNLSIDGARNLLDYLGKKILRQERWLKTKKE